MRFGKALVVCCLLLFLSAQISSAQQSSSQVTSALQSSLAAMIGTNPIRDVTLSGTVKRIAGSSVEDGTVVAVATSSGSLRVDLKFPSTTWSELSAFTAKGLTASWSKGDNAQHTIAGHNTLTTGTWFFPPFTLRDLVSSNAEVVSYLGQEKWNGVIVLHFVDVHTPTTTDAKASSLLRHLSETHLYLDPSSFLPIAIRFNTHPDNNLNIDIPVEIRFSDFQSMNGIRLPLHVEKYVNDTLAFEFTFQSVALNTGIAIPAVQ